MKSLTDTIKAESDSPTKCRKFAAEIDAIKGERRCAAILSTYTIKGLAECLKTKAFGHDIMLDVYEGEYSQWRQEIIGENLYSKDPEIVFLLLDFFGMDEDVFFGQAAGGFDVKGYAESRFDELWKYVATIKSKTTAKIIISNAIRQWPSLVGPLEGKTEWDLSVAINTFNARLLQAARADSQVFIFDMDGWLAYIGKKDAWHTRYFYMADMKLSPNAMPALAEEFMAYLVPLFGKKKKCIVLDLDNTLWGGIVGEDGVGGIELGPTGAGQPFYYFQKLLLHFKRRGILLAICSKNNEADVKDVFATHPHMVLKERDFVASRINWQDKAENIRSIAAELNIGLDSLLFVDDDPTNTFSVKEILKEVDVITLPKDPTSYVSLLLGYKGLGSLEYTEEDARRTDMYQSDKQRKKFETEAVDMESFLKGLDITLDIRPLDTLSLSRSAQLTQKTNQFNLTTYRYTEEDLKKFLDGAYKLWTLEVTDRFGQYGIVGLCIAKDGGDHWNIDSLLMSCRVLGRRIEFEFLGHVITQLHSMQHKKIRAAYIATKKNMQVKDFYSLFNFKKVASDQSSNTDIWELATGAYTWKPAGFITISGNIHEGKTL